MFSFSFRFFIKKIGKREIDPYLELKNLGTVMLHASRSPYPMWFQRVYSTGEHCSKNNAQIYESAANVAKKYKVTWFDFN